MKPSARMALLTKIFFPPTLNVKSENFGSLNIEPNSCRMEPFFLLPPLE